MNTCVTCQHDNAADARFCSQCGARLTAHCVACGAALAPDARFCSACGAAVSAAVAGSAAVARDPRAYTPPHLAEKILQSRAALEGERKHVTVLFVDVMGSMELAAALDPEDWHRVMDRFFEILSIGVHRFEGTINQYTGDGVMALFGAPIAHEDHAERACYAALALLDELAAYATDVKRRHGLGFSTRLGLNSGEVVVGAIGDNLRMDYTAQGPVVGIAQRMEALAEPNTCYLSAATARLVSGYFVLDELGTFNVRGVAEPLQVCRLAGLGSARSRLDRARSRGLSRFVGRGAELRQLADALSESDAGNGQVVGLVAEAGVGKSRLCAEFLEQCRARGMDVFECRAVAHGKGIPHLPILELFRAFFGIGFDTEPRVAREKIAGRLVELDATFAEELPLLYDFLGVSDPTRPALALEPEVRQRRLIDLMRRVTRAVSTRGTTVTLVEDLHWLDEASETFLAHLVDARDGAHSLLLLNYRPEYHAVWMQKSWFRQVPLAPLAVADVAAILAGMLGGDATIAALAPALHARTLGNPFFIEEILQALIDAGHLAGEPGRYRMTAHLDAVELPPTVQTLLAARIDRLPAREKQVLQTAAVIGKDFSEPLLAKVADVPEDALQAALDALVRAEFIYAEALYPVARYTFKHPLTQEVALGSQLRERRQRVHGAIARAVETTEAAHLDERAALLAHHYEQAGETVPAVRWHRRAAEWVARTDLSAAGLHWQRIRELLRDQSVDDTLPRDGLAACSHLLRLAFRLGKDPAAAKQLYEEGSTFAARLNDERAQLELGIGYCLAVAAAGDLETALPLGEVHKAAALRAGDFALQAYAWQVLGYGQIMAGRLRDARALIDDGLARFPRDLTADGLLFGVSPVTGLTWYRAWVLFFGGHTASAFAACTEVCHLAEAESTPEFVVYVQVVRVMLYYLAGDTEALGRSVRDLESRCRSCGDLPNMVALVHLGTAYLALATGRADEAVAAARLALAQHEHVVERVNAGWSATVLAEAVLATGAHREAVQAARRAIDLCRETHRQIYEAVALGLLASAQLRADGIAAVPEAADALESAAGLIESTGAELYAPTLLEWQAELAAVQGDTGGARELLVRAMQRYSERGAPHQVERLGNALPDGTAGAL